MRTISFASIKGGVGKTTLSSHVAAGLADSGRTTLLIDLDPQGHAGSMLGIELDDDEPCAADAFGNIPRRRFDEVVRQTERPGLYVAPASARMAGLERDLFRWGHRLSAISRALGSLSFEPDAVVIDTPPQLNAYTEAALAAGDIVVVPVPAMAHALQGFDEIHAAWLDARDGAAGEMIGVINLWDRRTSATNKAMEQAFADLPVKIARTRMPRSESVNQAGLGYELIYDFAPRSRATGAMRELVKELWRRAGLARRRKGS